MSGLANVQDLLVETLQHELYPWVASGAMAVLLASSLLSLIWHHITHRSMLIKARRALAESSDEREFTDQYESVSRKLSDIPRLRRTWEEFEETLIPPLDNIDDPSYRVYRNSKRPQTFFSSEHLLNRVRPSINSDFFIAVGLVLTFAGLAAALTATGNTISGDADTLVVKRAIEALLQIAGAKFVVSIFGLSFAIFQTVIQNLSNRSLAKHLGAFNDELERRLNYASLERIAADQYGHAMRQTKRLEAMKDELSLALGERIESAMTRMPELFGKELSSVMEPMNDNLAKVSSGIAETSAETLSDITSSVMGQIRDAGQQSMDQVVTQLASLSNTLDGTAVALQTSSEEIRGGLAAAVDSIRNTSIAGEAQIKAGAQAANDSMVQSIQASEQNQEAMRQQLAELTQQLADAAGRMTAGLQSAGDAAAEQLGGSIHSALTEILQQAKSSTEGIGVTVADSLASASDVAQAQLVQFADDFQQRLFAAMQGMEEGLGGWTRSSHQVSNALNAINSNLEINRKGLERSATTVNAAGDAFNSTAAIVRNAATPMAGAAAQTKDALNALGKLTGTALEAVQKIAGNLDRSAATSKESIEALTATWEAQAAQLGNVDEQLERAFSQITTNLAASLQTLQTFTDALSSKSNQAIETLGSVVQDLSDSIDSLGKQR